MARSVTRQVARLQLIDVLAPQIERCESRLREVRWRSSARSSSIKVRSVFFISTGGHRRSQPPMVRICAPRGLNLELYLLLLFEAQCRKRSGFAGPSDIPLSSSEPGVISWDKLVASRARENLSSYVTERQNRERQVRSAFTRLSAEGLARTERKPFRGFMVSALHEAGDTRKEAMPYSVPDRSDSKSSFIEIDTSFFTNGWLYLLTQSEIRLYFALLHLARIHPVAHAERGVYLPERIRLARYSMARDVYESHDLLSKIGLIERIENESRRPNGRIRGYEAMIARGEALPPHRFKVNNEMLAFKATRRVREALEYSIARH